MPERIPIDLALGATSLGSGRRVAPGMAAQVALRERANALRRRYAHNS
jgi:hypothetical protein